MNHRYKILIEYDGSDFSGWQKQPKERTVEGVVEEALSTLYQKEIDVIGQGRTDAGVHALQQVAHVDLPETYNEKRIIHAMRGLLPDDVTIYSIKKTHSKFHSRFDAVSRKYSYRVTNRPLPLERHKVWYCYMECDLVILNDCARQIMGEHDFLKFCIPNENPYLTTRCKITDSFWRQELNVMNYTIVGNRFLRQMVRRLVGTMVRVSAGEIELSEFGKMIKQPMNTNPVFTAPPSGLTLERVDYTE